MLRIWPKNLAAAKNPFQNIRFNVPFKKMKNFFGNEIRSFLQKIDL